MPNEESMRIAGAFSNYANTGNKDLIKNISEDKLEIALIQCAEDSRFSRSTYSAMERRLNELKDERKSKRALKDKWKDRIIAFALGIFATLICTYLKNLLKWN